VPKPVTHLSIRGIDPRVSAELRRIAAEEGISLNKAALKLLAKGAGITPEKRPARTIGHDLDHLAGKWTEAEARAFLESIRTCEEIDEEHWK